MYEDKQRLYNLIDRLVSNGVTTYTKIIDILFYLSIIRPELLHGSVKELEYRLSYFAKNFQYTEVGEEVKLMDKIIIQSIHPEVNQMSVVFNIEGTEYPKVLPFFTVSDANLLKQQLQSFAKELRGEFDSLKQAVQAQDQNNKPQVAPEVQALAGTEIPVDDNSGTQPSGGNGGGGTTTTTPSNPMDQGNASENPAVPSEPAQPVEPTAPSEPMFPSEPSAPTEPVQPTEDVDSTIL